LPDIIVKYPKIETHYQDAEIVQASHDGINHWVIDYIEISSFLYIISIHQRIGKIGLKEMYAGKDDVL
jgi:hypothetical protein